MEQINLQELSAEQIAELQQQLDVTKKERVEKVKQDRETYKTMVNDSVEALWTELNELSATIAYQRDKVFKTFESALALKQSIFGIKDNQQSHTFTDEKNRTITIGHRVVDRYDDTVGAGIAKVKQYVSEQAHDDKTKQLVETILNLLKLDKQGNLKASRVLELEKCALASQDKELLDGVAIIKAAHHAEQTRKFVSVSYKDETGTEVFLPLSISAV